jgi:hypothetical protein
MLEYSIRPCMAMVGYAALVAATVFLQQKFSECILAIGLYSICCRVTEACAVFDDCAYLASDPPTGGTALCVAALLLEWIRYRYVASVVRRVAEQQRIYDGLWGEMLAEEDNAHALARLEDLMRGDAPAAPPDCPSLQFNRQALPDGPADDAARGAGPRAERESTEWSRTLSSTFVGERREYGAPRTVPSTVDAGRPVSSLDQLYSQALGVVYILYSKCSDLCAQTGGRFAHADETDDAAAEVAAHGLPAMLARWVELGFVKRPSRALEKAAACYGGDASRLADVCRCRLAFDGLAALAACVERVRAQAPFVRVVRAKRRLGRGGGADDGWGGLRGVVLNVCFSTDETRSLGIEAHVCEIHLVPAPLALAHAAANHAHYREFRRLRAALLPAAASPWLRALLRPPPPSPATATLAHGCGWGAAAVWAAGEQSGLGGLPDPHGPQRGAAPGCMEGLEAGLQGEVVRAAREVYLRCTLLEGGHLDRKALTLARALRSSSAASALFSAAPVAAASTKPVFSLLFLGLAAYFAASYAGLLRATLAGGALPGAAAALYRLRPLQLRDAAAPANASGAWGFALLRDGCPIPLAESPAAAAPRVAGGGALLAGRPAGGAAPNGYRFRTAEGGPAWADPVRWVVESSGDKGSSWGVAGSSRWRWGLDGGVRLAPPGGAAAAAPYPTPEARGAWVAADHRPAAAAAALSHAWFVWNMATYLAMFALGALRRAPRAVRWVWIAQLCGNVAEQVAGGALALADPGGGAATAAEFLTGVPGNVVLACGLLWERHILRFTLAFAATLVAQACACHAALDRLGWADAPLSAYLAGSTRLAIFAAAAAAVILTSRTVSLRYAARLVAEDCRRYSAAWARVLEAQRADCLALRAIFQAQRPSADPRQLQCDGPPAAAPPPPGAWALPRGWWGRGAGGRGVDSLDQLFVQASCLRPILAAKVRGWAAAAGGLFPYVDDATGEVSFEPYAEWREGRGGRYKWAGLKSAQRAVEKVVRAYDGDVSRLLDLCRETMVFEDLRGLCEGARALLGDPDVRVLRVKNRMDPGWDAGAAGGYRDVLVNLQICTEQTRWLRVDQHVCELQLSLRGLAEVKSDEGHRNYVRFRNQCGQ